MKTTMEEAHITHMGKDIQNKDSKVKDYMVAKHQYCSKETWIHETLTQVAKNSNIT